MKKRLATTVALLTLLASLGFAPPAFAGAVPATSALSYAAGYEHVLAVRADGTVWGWGSNANDQLHPTLNQFVKSPAKIEGLKDAVSVAAGFGTSAALDKDGAVYVWGNKDGVKAVGPFTAPVVKIAASNEDFLALQSDGIVFQWSQGGTPAWVDLPRVIDIAAGANHFLALTTQGRVYSWGGNSFGQLGDGTTTDRSAPKSLSGVYEASAIGTGSNHSFAITKTGEIYGWGNNREGQVGVGHMSDIIKSPQKLELPDKIASATGGDRHSLALTADGRLYSWGNAEYGQLANGTLEGNSSPKIAAKDKSFDSIAAGANFTIAYRSGGLLTSGRSNNGQLGDGGQENALSLNKEVFRGRPATPYSVDVLSGISNWARSDAQKLYDKGVTPFGILWGFKSNITRSEFAALLVSAYEMKKAEVKEPGDNPFGDTSASPFVLEITKANKLGIVNGKSADVFDPDAAVTREEAAKMISITYTLIRGNAFPETVNVAVPYADASQIANWAMPYVAYAYDNKILQGTDTGGFLPKGNMTREAAMVAVSRMT
ncbi:MAG: S-layer homology domain-containing protein [Clostridiales Family XIII bacterium]|jgi:alpha-tubulin suppressor-like RCC1 family protein|nr:S-layer homology domain-containing protein [Clostridiales Family XIII bacterium]